jgi:hypothetical protein
MTFLPTRAFRIAFLLALFVFISGGRLRASTDVTVTVTQGGVGVEGAFVALAGPNATKFAAVTDATGKAVFSQVPDAIYVAHASASGTSAGSVSLTTPAGTARTSAVVHDGLDLSHRRFGTWSPVTAAAAWPVRMSSA